MINESVTSICNNRDVGLGFWTKTSLDNGKIDREVSPYKTRHTHYSIVWKKVIWEMGRDLNACSAQCVKVPFFVQKVQILEKLEKWSIFTFFVKIDHF